jgi:hypothetical protein
MELENEQSALCRAVKYHTKEEAATMLMIDLRDCFYGSLGTSTCVLGIFLSAGVSTFLLINNDITRSVFSEWHFLYHLKNRSG